MRGWRWAVLEDAVDAIAHASSSAFPSREPLGPEDREVAAIDLEQLDRQMSGAGLAADRHVKSVVGFTAISNVLAAIEPVMPVGADHRALHALGAVGLPFLTRIRTGCRRAWRPESRSTKLAIVLELPIGAS